MTIFRLR